MREKKGGRGGRRKREIKGEEREKGRNPWGDGERD